MDEEEETIWKIFSDFLCHLAAFNQIVYQSTRYGPIHRFSFLRISDNLLYNSVNWNMFTTFVAQMKAAGRREHLNADEEMRE